nr:translation initiation factor IF-2-like [Manis javanica]
MGEEADRRGCYCRKIPTALPFPGQPGEGLRLPRPWEMGEGVAAPRKGRPGQVSVPTAAKRPGRMYGGVGAGGPQFSSGAPSKHGRRKQDFQTPVQSREGRNPAPRSLEPRRALCGKAPGWRRASPAPGSRREKGIPAGEKQRQGGGSGATYGRDGEGGSGGPSAGPGRRGRTAEAPRLRRAGLRWAPSWSAPRARPPRRSSPCIIDDSRPPRATARVSPPPGPPPALPPRRPPARAPRPRPAPASPRPAAHLPLQGAPVRPQRAARPPASPLAGSQAGPRAARTGSGAREQGAGRGRRAGAPRERPGARLPDAPAEPRGRGTRAERWDTAARCRPAAPPASGQ